MINEIKKTAEQKMQKSIAKLETDFAKVRTGRAHPSLLDHVMVDYYGSASPLSQVASISVADSRTLAITPWEKTMVQAIEKAIMNADLGLNPATAGTVIRVPMPALTEERRKEMTKVVRGEAENAKVAVRNIRRDANQSMKDLLKDKDITEDEDRRGQDAIQKLTDKYIADIDKLTVEKESDLMTV